eukprot:scaffold32912_cov60-Phaeocystis_antarctica.AAC.3
MITFVRPGKRAKPYSSGGASRIGPRTKIGAAVPATCARAALRVQDVPAHSTSSSAWICCIEQQRGGVNTDWPPWPSDETAPPASVPSKGSGQRTGKVGPSRDGRGRPPISGSWPTAGRGWAWTLGMWVGEHPKGYSKTACSKVCTHERRPRLGQRVDGERRTALRAVDGRAKGASGDLLHGAWTLRRRGRDRTSRARAVLAGHVV